MRIVQKKTFADNNVELDGNGFVDCTFTNCHLIFRGKKAFGLKGPTLDNVTMEFADHAALTLQTLHLLYANGGSSREWVEQELMTVSGSVGEKHGTDDISEAKPRTRTPV